MTRNALSIEVVERRAVNSHIQSMPGKIGLVSSKTDTTPTAWVAQWWVAYIIGFQMVFNNQ